MPPLLHSLGTPLEALCIPLIFFSLTELHLLGILQPFPSEAVKAAKYNIWALQ